MYNKTRLWNIVINLKSKDLTGIIIMNDVQMQLVFPTANENNIKYSQYDNFKYNELYQNINELNDICNGELYE
jgi:hypothetical protein